MIKNLYTNFCIYAIIISYIKVIKNMTKRTLNGTKKKVIAVSGFRARMKNKQGSQVINNRRRKKRKKLSIGINDK